MTKHTIVLKTQEQEAKDDYNNMVFIWGLILGLFVTLSLGFFFGFGAYLLYIGVVTVVVFLASDLTKGVIKGILKAVVSIYYVIVTVFFVYFYFQNSTDKGSFFYLIWGLVFLFLAARTLYKHTPLIIWLKNTLNKQCK